MFSVSVRSYYSQLEFSFKLSPWWVLLAINYMMHCDVEDQSLGIGAMSCSGLLGSFLAALHRPLIGNTGNCRICVLVSFQISFEMT